MQSAGVLVVEDEAVVSLDIQKTLRNMQHRVIGTASTGDGAIGKARECLPDIVLMDIGIPGTMNGIGAARVIQDELDIPVIFVTAWADDATLHEVGGINPYGYIVKPFRDHDIRVAIELALSRKSGEREEQRSEAQQGPAAMTGDATGTGPNASLSDIRALFRKGFFHGIVLLLYSNADIKERVFSSFIEHNLESRGDLIFAYSQSRAHRNFLPEIQNGKIHICRIKAGEVGPVKSTLLRIFTSTSRTDPVPQKVLIDFSEQYRQGEIREVVDRVIAVQQAGVPVSGIIALSARSGDESLFRDLSQRIPSVVAATGGGTLISCADQSFPLESLSFLPQAVVDETVKKVLEPVVLSLLQKPISGQDILLEIRDRYNISVPKARVYMLLYDLQKKGYLTVRIVGKSKLYSATDPGKKHIRQKLDEFTSTFHHILSEMADRSTSKGFPGWEE